MTTIHAQKSVYAGDVWEFHGRLYERDRSLLDIEGAVVEWALLDSTGTEVIGSDDVTITINLPVGVSDGTFKIVVPETKTKTVPAGIYKDGLRVTSVTIPRETLWTGPIIVKAALFTVA